MVALVEQCSTNTPYRLRNQRGGIQALLELKTVLMYALSSSFNAFRIVSELFTEPTANAYPLLNQDCTFQGNHSSG